MEPKFRSILQELMTYGPRTEDQDLMIETKAIQVLASVSNLIQLIESTYDEETAADLTKRLFNSAKSGNGDKFRRKIRSIRESREDK